MDAPLPICAPGDRVWVLTAAILVSALGYIDGSVVAIAMPAMRADLGASLVGAQWIGAGYLLALSSLVLTAGAMGDRFGVARVFGLGIAVFVLASIGCTLAPTTETMIAARVLQGIGAGIMVPGSMALVSRAYPPDQRARALGLWVGFASASTVAGPVLGGVVLTWGPDWAWRLIFALNLPVGAFALWILWARTRADHGRPGTPVDLPGAALACAALALLAWGLTGIDLRFLAAGLALFAGFLLHQSRAAAPMLRLGMFADRGFSAANLATLFLFFALPAVLFYLPMTAVTAWGAREIDVTLMLLPLGVLIGALSPVAGRLAHRFGPGPLIGLGALCVAVSDAGLAWVAEGPDLWRQVLPLMALTGFGMGLVAAPLSAGVMAAAGETEQGAASGINNAVARVANLVAVALMGAVAAWAYARAGGQASFAATADLSAAHRAATTAGFATVAGAASVAALIAALISWTGIRRPVPQLPRPFLNKE